MKPPRFLLINHKGCRHCQDAEMVMDPNGPLIGYAWFEQLEAENVRLNAEVERLTERNKFLEQIDSYLQGANENAYEKRCDELESELERLRKAGDWRPIETAPKDGADVLCISGEYMFVAWIDSRGYWNSGDDSRFVPDYWMPLPKPPAAKEGKQP